jgi:hypothetical protein
MLTPSLLSRGPALKNQLPEGHPSGVPLKDKRLAGEKPQSKLKIKAKSLGPTLS